jgi:hypothetical protein
LVITFFNVLVSEGLCYVYRREFPVSLLSLIYCIVPSWKIGSPRMKTIDKILVVGHI